MSMTEQDAIKMLAFTKYNCGRPVQGDSWSPNRETMALDMAMTALDEVAEYRKIGNVSVCAIAVSRTRTADIVIDKWNGIRDELKNLLKCYRGDEDTVMRPMSIEEYLEEIIEKMEPVV